MKARSTYYLLIDSQEKGRSIFEVSVYGLVMLSAVMSVLQLAS